MKEKSVTFCFLKLETKEKANFSKIIRGRVTFLWRIWVSSFKSNVYALSFHLKPYKEWWKPKTRDYHQKLNCFTNCGTVEKMIIGNEELLRLFNWVFIDLMICGLELVTRGFEFLTRGSELLTPGFELAFLNFNSCF